MTDISRVVVLNITRATLGVQQSGFGVPMILSANAAFIERIRFYADLDEVEVDFATTTVEWAYAAALFGQTIQPEQIAIGRCANKPTQKYTLTPTAANLTLYRVTINGENFDFTSDADGTAAEIVTGLIALINASSGHTLTATGTSTLILTADAVGNYNAVSVADVTLLSIIQDHADPGLAADLAAIANISNAWYFILYPYGSKACGAVIATYAEANKKIYLADSNDTASISVVVGTDTATSLMGAAKAGAYERTSVWYHENPGVELAAALCGRLAPTEPGSETWDLKKLTGPTASDLTSTHLTNADAKNGNYYIEIGGQGATQLGKVASGEYIDVIRFLDWLEARIAEAVYSVLINADKVAYTDAGIALIQGAIENVLTQGVEVGGLAADPAPRVTVPKASAASTANKAARHLTGVKFSGTLAGAIHKVTIAGNVSL